jgi:hypothetical protein
LSAYQDALPLGFGAVEQIVVYAPRDKEAFGRDSTGLSVDFDTWSVVSHLPGKLALMVLMMRLFGVG